MSEKLTVPMVLNDFLAYQARPENGAWGSLHIVMEDENVRDGNVRFCEQWARDRDDDEGVRLARILQSMSRTQRLRLSRTCAEARRARMSP